MKLSTLAVAVSLALGAGLLTGCDRDAGDRAVSRTTPPAGSASSSSAGSTTTPASGRRAPARCRSTRRSARAPRAPRARSRAPARRPPAARPARALERAPAQPSGSAASGASELRRQHRKEAVVALTAKAVFALHGQDGFCASALVVRRLADRARRVRHCGLDREEAPRCRVLSCRSRSRARPRGRSCVGVHELYAFARADHGAGRLEEDPDLVDLSHQVAVVDALVGERLFQCLV